METVTARREIAAAPDEVRGAMEDLEAFMASAGFDRVEIDGDEIVVANRIGPTEIELVLAVEDTDDALAYRQREGIFEEMTTRYRLAPTDDGTAVTAETRFALDLAVVGGFLDATVITRQRRRELAAQMDHLVTTVGADGE